ncbi:MAG: sugar ABC transporter permease [Chloroflexota bacterium]|nr:sugar ABC transporter permease [Chloroflexota bacterium]
MSVSDGRAGTAGMAAGPVIALPPRRRWRRQHREWLAAYLFLAPDVLGLLIFLVVPMVLALTMGFFRVSGFGDYTFIGLANYQRLFSDELFLNSVRVTTVYAVVLVIGVYVVSLGLALLVQQRLPLIGLLRSLFFLPHIVSLVVVGFVWQFLLVGRVGVINKVLAAVGFEGRSWLGDPQFALGTVLIVTIWFLMGFYMIVFLAGLQEIPPEYYDAARIDGASFWEMFRSITLPLLRPTSFFVILVTMVAAVAGQQGVDLTVVMTRGGPDRSTSLVTYYVYQQAFEVGDYGYAAAIASFLVVFLLGLTAVLFALTRGGRFEFD